MGQAGVPRREMNRSTAPRRGPEELADLISLLSSQEKAEITYELVVLAARAAGEGELAALRLFLAELEDMAEVYADPVKRRDLERAMEEAKEVPAQGGAAAGVGRP